MLLSPPAPARRLKRDARHVFQFETLDLTEVIVIIRDREIVHCNLEISSVAGTRLLGQWGLCHYDTIAAPRVNTRQAVHRLTFSKCPDERNDHRVGLTTDDNVEDLETVEQCR